MVMCKRRVCVSISFLQKRKKGGGVREGGRGVFFVISQKRGRGRKGKVGIRITTNTLSLANNPGEKKRGSEAERGKGGGAFFHEKIKQHWRVSPFVLKETTLPSSYGRGRQPRKRGGDFLSSTGLRRMFNVYHGAIKRS